MKITFIRHAEKEETGEDPYLTKKGVKQAKYLAKKLRREKFDEFYCSDMNRAITDIFFLIAISINSLGEKLPSEAVECRCKSIFTISTPSFF